MHSPICTAIFPEQQVAHRVARRFQLSFIAKKNISRSLYPTHTSSARPLGFILIDTRGMRKRGVCLLMMLPHCNNLRARARAETTVEVCIV